MNRALVIASSPDEQTSELPPEAPPLANGRSSPASTVSRRHHQLVVEGVRAVWSAWGREILDLLILSSTLGLRQADEFMVPYDASSHPRRGDWPASSPAVLSVRDQAATRARDYSLVIYLLGKPHLAAMDLPLPLHETARQIVLTDEDGLALLPAAPDLCACLADGGSAARRWHVKSGHVRGFLFRRLCGQIVQHGPALLEWLRREPEAVDHLFYKRALWRPQLSLWPGMGD